MIMWLFQIPPAGSIRRALNSLLALWQGLTACCGCCGRLRRQRTVDAEDLNAALWKSIAQPEGVLDDGAPPELSEAAAQQAAAAMSAAMSAKLAAAAALRGSGAPAALAKAPLGHGSEPAGAEAGSLHQGLLAAPPPAAGGQQQQQQQQQQQDGLIKAGPGAAPAASAAGSPPAVAAEYPPCDSPKLSHVDSLVQYFERLSPSKAEHAQHVQQQPAGGLAPQLAQATDSLDQHILVPAAQVPAGPMACGSSRPEASSHEPAGMAASSGSGGMCPSTGGKPRPLPGRTESRRAFLRAISRHARFAGVPEEAEEGSAPASTTAIDPSDSPSSSSAAANPGAVLLTSKQPGSIVLSSTKGTSTGRPSSRLQRGSGARSSSYDQQVAAELQDADGASDFSGISGNSSSEALVACIKRRALRSAMLLALRLRAAPTRPLHVCSSARSHPQTCLQSAATLAA